MITTPTKQSIGGVDCTIITYYFLRVLGVLRGLPPWTAVVPISNKFLPLAKT